MLAESNQVLSGPLKVHVTHEGDRRIVSLQGELDLSSAAPVLRQLEKAIADPECQQIVVDMEALEFIDSSGIAALLRAQRRDAGRDRLRIVPSRHLGVTRVLEVTGLDSRLTPVDEAA
jgi:anti-sigma B factor antagonist